MNKIGLWAKQHGIGLSYLETSAFPGISKKAKTPDVKQNETFTGLKSQNPDPRHQSIWNFFGKTKKRIAPDAPGDFTHGCEAKQLKLLSESKKKFTHNIDENTPDQLINSEKYFPNPGDNQLKHLHAAITQVRARVPPDPSLPKELQGAEMTVLTQALSAVSKERPNGIDDVARGLACLQNIDMLAAVRDPAAATLNALNTGGPTYTCPNYATDPLLPNGHAAGAAFDQDDFDCAWRLAQVLGSTPTGFDLLQKITVVPAVNAHETVIRHDKEMLHVYLDATREMREEAIRAGQQPVYDPHAVYTQLDNAVTNGNGGTPVPFTARGGGAGGGPGQAGAVIAGNGNANLTVLQKGLLALRDHLDQSADHIASAGGRAAANPFDIKEAPNQFNGNAWAINFIRNGIYSDAAQDADGNPSRYALLNGRVGKTGTWAQRALADRQVGVWNKFKAGMTKHFAPQLNKSPLNAYNRLGDGPNAVGFKNTVGSNGIAEGRAFKENIIPNLRLALVASGGGTNAAHAALGGGNAAAAVMHNAGGGQPTVRELTNVVRMALLDEVMQTKMLTRFADCEPLDEFQLESVKDRIYAYLGGNRGNNGNLNAANIQALTGIINAQNRNGFTPEVLVGWASQLTGGPANVAAAQGAAGPNANPGANQPDWPMFCTGINHVTAGVINVPATLNLNVANPGIGLQGARVTAMAAQLEENIEQHELGQKFSFSSGGTAGASTGTLSYWLTTLATLGNVRVRGVDIGYERGRHAVFEAGTLTTGHELIMATETTHRYSGGVGGSAGPGLNLGKGWTIGASGSFDAGYANEDAHRRGAILRFRRLYSGVNGDRAQNAKLGRLATKVVDPGNVHPDGTAWIDPPRAADGTAGDSGSILKRAAQEWPDLSISWMNQKERTHRGGPTASGSAGFTTKWLSLGALGAGLGAEGRKTTKRWQEQGGSLHVDKRERTDSFKVNGQLIGPLVAAIPGSTGLGLPGLLFGQVKGDFYRVQRTIRDSYIYEDGKFSQRTYRTITYSNSADFVKWALPQMADQAVDKADNYMKERYHHVPKPWENPVNGVTPEEWARRLKERETVIQKEFKTLLQHLEEQLKKADLNQGLQIYYEPREEVVKTVNLMKSLRDSAVAAGDMKAAEDCDERISKLLWDDNSWINSYLVDTDTVTRQKWEGLNVLGKDQKVDKAEFSRIRNFK